MRRFFRLDRQEKRLFFEAARETLLVRLVTTFSSTAAYASWPGQNRVETETIEFDAERNEQVRQIKDAISRCRHLVWSRKCLVESIAAKRMLDRRRIPATLYMGVAKNGKGKMIAHAWIRSGNIYVAGGRNRQRFTVVGMFS